MGPASAARGLLAQARRTHPNVAPALVDAMAENANPTLMRYLLEVARGVAHERDGDSARQVRQMLREQALLPVSVSSYWDDRSFLGGWLLAWFFRARAAIR